VASPPSPELPETWAPELDAFDFSTTLTLPILNRARPKRSPQTHPGACFEAGRICTIPWSNTDTPDQYACVRCALPARECALRRLNREEVQVLTSARRPASLATAYLLGLISSAGPRIARVLLLLARGKLTLRAARLQVRPDPSLVTTRRKSRLSSKSLVAKSHQRCLGT
jgi:hypothetical protein